MIEQPASTPSASPPRSAVRLPLSKPRLTYLLLGVIVLVFLLETILGGSTNMATLQRLGGQINSLIAGGDYWRLLSSVFIHIGLTHVAFNSWALFSLGREVEGFYGPARFGAIFLVAGVAGGVAYLLFGSDILSAGASGAVFGLIGAEIAFFLRNRLLFGAIGRQRLGNLGGLVAINLVLGFTIPGINNIAHLGGLVGGFLLGLGLTPRYELRWSWSGDGASLGAQTGPPPGPQPRLTNRTPGWLQGVAVLLACVLLAVGIWLGVGRWIDSPASLNQRALAALDSNDISLASQLLEEAVAADPNDAQSYFNLGVVREQQGDEVAAIAAFQEVTRLAPEYVASFFNIGILAARQGDWSSASAALEEALALDPQAAETYYQLGLVYAHQGELDRSIRSLEAARGLAPTDSDIMFALGQLYSQTGRSTDAREALEGFLAENPSGAGAAQARQLLDSLAP